MSFFASTLKCVRGCQLFFDGIIDCECYPCSLLTGCECAIISFMSQIELEKSVASICLIYFQTSNNKKW